jgi:hypothetical protein
MPYLHSPFAKLSSPSSFSIHKPSPPPISKQVTYDAGIGTQLYNFGIPRDPSEQHAAHQFEIMTTD